MKLSKAELQELYRMSKTRPELTHKQLGLNFGLGAYTTGCLLKIMSAKERKAAKLKQKKFEMVRNCEGIEI